MALEMANRLAKTRARLRVPMRNATVARTSLGPLLAVSLLVLATGCGDNPTSEMRKANLNSRWESEPQWEGGNEKTFHFVFVEIDHKYAGVGTVQIGFEEEYGFLWPDMPETQAEGFIWASVSVKGAEITSLTPMQTCMCGKSRNGTA